MNLLYPMAAMVLLTFAVLMTLFVTRVRAVMAGVVEARYFKTYQGEEPEASAKLANHFRNLFEAPVLFYAACLAALTLDSTSTLLVVLAWAFVALRAGHALIHIGANRLRPRIAVYLSSWLVLLLMWGALVVP